MLTDEGQKVSGSPDHDLDDASGANFAWMDPAALHTRPPFEGLFRIKPGDLARITESMKKPKGFDESQPIHVWRQGDRVIVIDGHTRRLAAIEANVRVYVYCHDFADEDAALDYALANQRDRRNIGDDELYTAIMAVDQLKKKGGAHESTSAGPMFEDSNIGKSGRSHEETAARVGTSPDKVLAARAIHSDLEIEKEVLAGRKKILRGGAEVRAKRKAAKATKGGSAPAPEEAKAVPAVKVVPAGPRRETIKARCAEIWAPIKAEIRREYDAMPPDHHGVFTQMAFTDMSLLKSEAENEPAPAGKAEHEVTLKMITDINTKASAPQIQRAYEAHFGREMTDRYALSAASRELIAAMGHRAAKAFVLKQSKDTVIRP
jgi:hypothetical protein